MIADILIGSACVGGSSFDLQFIFVLCRNEKTELTWVATVHNNA
jgi:hypothetical protein